MTSGCAPSPWKWSVLHITGVFSVSSQYTIHGSLRHLHCLGNVRYYSPRCFHPDDLPSLADGTFPHDEVKLNGHKSWLLGWPKLCWFQLYCSKTILSISLIFARHVTRYIVIILTIFQETTQCLTLWKISLENFCKNFFPGVYMLRVIRILSRIFWRVQVSALLYKPPLTTLMPKPGSSRRTLWRSWQLWPLY